MNLDDDSLLSAFFDDELDPGERPGVAALVDSSPELAGLLADLGGVRAAIQALERPAAPVDLTFAVLARLADAPLRPAPADEAGSELEVIALPDPPVTPRRRGWAGRALMAASFVGVGSVAASLLVATFVLFHALHDTTRPGGISELGATAPSRTYPSDPSPPAESDLAARLDADLPTPAVKAPAPPRADSLGLLVQQVELKAKAKDKGPGESALSADDRPPKLGEMLAQPRVVRVAVSAEAPDRAATRVREIIEQTPDRDAEFGRISVPAGLVVDPDRPEAAEVFAVVVRDGDERDLVGRLRAGFPEKAEVAEASPDLVMHLAEVGDAAVIFKVPPARLGKPPIGLPPPLIARKVAHPPDPLPIENQPSRQRAAEVEPGDHPAQAQQRAVDVARQAPGNGAPQVELADLAKPIAPAPAPAAGARLKADAAANGPVTVLIWITRSAPR